MGTPYVRQFRYDVTSLDGGQGRKVIRAGIKSLPAKDTILGKDQPSNEAHYISRERGVIGAATAQRNWAAVQIMSGEVPTHISALRDWRRPLGKQALKATPVDGRRGTCLVVVEPRVWKR
jgi:hypothetical protein